MPECQHRPELILQGQVRDLDLGSLLSALRLGRQYLTLELFDAAGESKGVVSVKSGRILSALAGEERGAAAVRRLLESRDAAEFRVRLQPSDADLDAEPVATIDELAATQLSPAHRPVTEAPVRPTNGFRKTLPPPLPRATRPSTASSPRRARILEGNLDEFELAHVLQVLSTSRQHFELHVRDDAAGSIGVIEVKSGVVIGASTDTLSGVEAARELLNARSGRFVAIRRTDASSDRPPLISVSALLQPPAATDDPEAAFEDTQTISVTEALTQAANQDTPAVPAPIPVLDGKLGDLDVASILHVAGASRQYTCVHVFDDQRRPIGVIHLKSGHLVAAQAQDVTGVAAVRRLLHSPRDFSYLVQRYPNAAEVSSSIGSISSVLERAATQVTQASQPTAAQPQRTLTPTHLTPVTNTQPRRSSGAPNSSWMGGAVLGAGFVLLGGIATAIVLRSPALNTSVSPISTPPPAPAPAPAPAPLRPPAPHLDEPSSQPSQPAAISGGSNPTEPSPLAASSGGTTPSRAAIASFQAGLRQLGYEPGPIDGVIGPRTAAAIKAFQYAEHLAVDGTLSAPTRAVLLRRISEP